MRRIAVPRGLDASFAENVWFPLRILVEQIVWPSRAWKDNAEWSAEGHIASVKDVSRHALATLETSHADRDFSAHSRAASGRLLGSPHRHIRDPADRISMGWITQTGCWGRCLRFWNCNRAGGRPH